MNKELNLGFVQKNVAGQLTNSRQLLDIYRHLTKLAESYKEKDPAVAAEINGAATQIFKLANNMVNSASEMGSTVARFITNQ